MNKSAARAETTVQKESALFTIKMLYTAIPAGILVIALIFLAFYDLEKRLPKIQEDLKNKK